MQSLRETSVHMLCFLFFFGMVIILKADDNDFFAMLGIERVKTTVEAKQNLCKAGCTLHNLRNAVKSNSCCASK